MPKPTMLSPQINNRLFRTVLAARLEVAAGSIFANLLPLGDRV